MPEMVRKRPREPAAAAFSLRPPVGSVPFPGLFQAGEAAAQSAWVSLHFDLWLKCFSSGYPLKAPPVVLVTVWAGLKPPPPSSSIAGSEIDGWAARPASGPNGPAQGREVPAREGPWRVRDIGWWPAAWLKGWAGARTALSHPSKWVCTVGSDTILAQTGPICSPDRGPADECQASGCWLRKLRVL